MKFIRFFNKIRKEDVSLAGGKGASLGEMYNSSIPVPNGFVILSSTFDRFIRETKLDTEISLILKKVNLDHTKTINLASKKIQTLILAKDLPKDLTKEILSSFKKLNTKFVAVRSSATSEDSKDAAWAGQLNTYLNTTNKNLLINIKNCWASLFTERAIFYRFEKKLETKHISVAVVIQRMVESEKSGIAFSVHPVTEDPNQLIIEAGFGLGEAIVSGQVTPNSYVVTKKPHKIMDKNISEQKRELVRSKGKDAGGIIWKDIPAVRANSQVLTDKEILELSTLVQKIEDHYNFPVDVEWAIEKNKIYITQSRPITTLKEKKEEKPIFELEFQRETPIFMFDIWLYSYLNVCKNIFKWKRDITKTNGVYKDGIVSGYTIVNNIELMKESINKIDINKLNELLTDYSSNYLLLIKNKKKVYHNKFIIDLFSGFIINFILGDLNSNKLCPVALKLRKETENLFPLVQKELHNKVKHDNYRYTEIIDNKKISLVVLNKRNNCIVYETKIIFKKENKIKLHKEHSREYSFSKMYSLYRSFSYYFTKIKLIKRDLKYTSFIYYGKDLINVYYDNNELLAVFKEIEVNANNNPKLVDESVNNLLRTFNICLPYFKGKKLTSIKEYKKVVDSFGECWAEIAVVFVLPEDNLNVSKAIKEKALSLREKTQEYNEALEPIFKEFIETNFPYLKEKYRFILPEEIINGDVKNKPLMLKRIKERQKGFVYYQGKIYTGNVDKTLDKLNLYLEKQDTKVKELKGQIAYKGKTEGRVRVITSQKQILDFKEGEIMVTAMTMPTYLPAMKKASAFVTDEGGITSHAAIIARELKKPCVIGTKVATEVLKNGDLVEVDADNGTVKILTKCIPLDTIANNFINELKNQKLVPPQHNSSILVQASCWNFSKYFKKYYDDNLELSVFVVSKGGDGVLYYPFTKLIHLSFEFFKKYWINTNELEKRINLFENYKQQCDELYNQLTTTFINNTNISKLIKLIKKSYLLTIELNAFSAFSFYFDRDMFDKLIVELNLININKEKVWNLGTNPIINSFDKERRLYFLVLISQHKSIEVIVEKCMYFGASYGFVKSKENLKAELVSEYDKYFKNPQLAKLEINHVNQELKIKKNKFKSELKKLNENEIKLIYYLNKIIELRDARKDIISKLTINFYNVLFKLFKKYNLSEDLIYYYSMLELLKGEAHLVKNIELIKKRVNGYCCFASYYNEIYDSYDFDTNKKIIDDFYNSQINISSKLITGQSTYKGKITGIVRIIRTKNDFLDFKDNEILVAGMTRPEFISLIKRASAIVTDEGGITCHAAIVSRELKKPCVIGTKVATSILKTGDKVEVDADNGIVKILDTNNKEKPIELINKKYFETIRFWAREATTPLFALTDKRKIKAMKNNVIFYKDKRTHFYYINNYANELMNNYHIYFSNKKNVVKYIKDTELMEKKVIAFVNSCKQINYSKLSNSKLYSEFNRTTKIMYEFYNLYLMTEEACFTKFDAKKDKNLLNQIGKIRFEFSNLKNRLYPILVANILWNLSKKEHLSLKNDLFFYTINEIITLFKTHKKVPSKIIAERRKGYVLIVSNNKLITFTGEKFKDLWKEANTLPDINNKEIRGTSVYSGKVTGKVKLVFWTKNFSKKVSNFKTGDILVTDMTKPEMVSLCRKAKAIITDEGGITSHAAIIAREYKIPCIVGTKIATQILKTGDLVEVNANNAVVRILKK